ncbi:hypothetical protein, partial [Actinocorallia lasiicapitis]
PVPDRGGPLRWASAPAGTEPQPLPKRTSQSSLAPQLVREPPAVADDRFGVPPELTERSSSALTAFQRGTARARSEAAGLTTGPQGK